MTPGIYVGVDSGGTLTNVDIVVRAADGHERRKSYQAAECLSGALEHALIPKVLGRILARLPMELEELTSELEPVTSEKLPTYVWVGAAGYTSWTRDEFTTALLDIRPTIPGEVAAMGAANDAVTLLLASGADGIVIAGTGSNVILQSKDGTLHQAGGHDWVACDYGSGFWIGLEGIRRAFRDYEAGIDSTLLQRLRYTYGVRSPTDHRGLISKMRDLAIASPDLKREIARFTALVCSAAEKGDSASQNLVKNAAEELAEVAVVALRRWFSTEELASGVCLFLCGSVLNNKFYRDAFESQIRMRLRSSSGDQLPVAFESSLTGSDSCVKLASQLDRLAGETVRLPIDFRPSIVEFK